MCICVWLFGVQLFVFGSREGQGELIAVVVNSAVEVKFKCEYVSCGFEQKVEWINSW